MDVGMLCINKDDCSYTRGGTIHNGCRNVVH